MDLGTRAAGIGALADDTRRALYEYVAAQPGAVGREEVAEACGVATHTVRFHLDRLVDEGLLEVEFRRLTGRSGPGAGRPSKLYRRTHREFSVSLPERRYDLVGHILAEAFARARDGQALDDALQLSAREEGLGIGAQASSGPRPSADLPRVAQVLGDQGFEPRLEDDAVVLVNCPFDSLARDHTDLVCGLNQHFVQGVADGLRCPADACLEPGPDRCCVTLRRRST